jgi:hypothetical protein
MQKQGIEAAMDDLQRRHFFPMQKQAFLCSAKWVEPWLGA